MGRKNSALCAKMDNAREVQFFLQVSVIFSQTHVLKSLHLTLEASHLLTGVVRFNDQVISFLTTVICNPVHTCMNVELEVVVIRRSTAGYIQYSIITLERYTFSLFIRWLNW